MSLFKVFPVYSMSFLITSIIPEHKELGMFTLTVLLLCDLKTLEPPSGMIKKWVNNGQFLSPFTYNTYDQSELQRC